MVSFVFSSLCTVSPAEDTTETVKVVVVGDGAVGKSCLLISYTTKSFPSHYVPTVFDNYTADVLIGGKRYNLGLWDTAGQEDYDRLRPLSYPETDVFLVCFSVDRHGSLKNITSKWIPEIQYHCPHAPVVIVACKTDLRRSVRGEAGQRCVSFDEGLRLAKHHGASYTETSSLTQEGLQECFNTAISVLVDSKLKPKTKGFKLFGRKAPPEPELIPPVMPPAGKAPWIEIETSTFAEDWYLALQNPRFDEVTFLVEAKHRLRAHSNIISSASTFFAKVLSSAVATRDVATRDVATNSSHQLDHTDSFNRQDLNSGKIEGISKIYETDSDGRHGITVELSTDIKARTFGHVLEFLYTGTPRITEEAEEDLLKDLKRVSAIFKIPFLSTICDITKGEDFLNPSIGTFLNDETSARIKQLYLNQQHHADVVFDVEGTQIFAHKNVLCARNAVMAAMFSGHFLEGSKNKMSNVPIPGARAETFLSVLEYLYTDHASLEHHSDMVGVLMLADENCQPRLVNMCELYISKGIEHACQNRIEKAEIDVVGLLKMARMCNANQLVEFCLHFISTNYQAFSRRAELTSLDKEDLEHVQTHQWPPLSYLSDVKEFEKKAAHKRGKCVIM